MKKITLVVSVIIMSITGFSQIIQEKVVVAKSIGYSEFIQLETNGDKYFIMNGEDMKLTIYNINHSIFKTVLIDLSALGLEDYPNFNNTPYPFAISESLFDTDTDIEFAIYLDASSSDWLDNKIVMAIINEDGSVLFKANNQSPTESGDEFQFPAWLKNTESGTKMILQTYNHDENDSLFVYSLPGEVPCFICGEDSPPNKVNSFKSSDNKLNSYPNPAKDYTIIEYEIPNGQNEAEIYIYNVSGQIVKRFRVDRTFNTLRISTDDLKAGTYLYNMKSGVQMSKGKKMIVVK